MPISPTCPLVPDGQPGPRYFRGGNTTGELILVVLLRDGVPMRYFPIAAKGDVHVPLRVVEDIEGGSVIELQLIALVGVSGSVVVDLGTGGAPMTDILERLDAKSETNDARASWWCCRQRHGWRPCRGDLEPRRRRDVQDHDVRRRAVRQLQPDHAQPRAVRCEEDDSDIFLNSLAWYEENHITLHAGVRVNRIDRYAKVVFSDNGEATSYDMLILATGSRSFMPQMDGLYDANGSLLPGVFASGPSTTRGAWLPTRPTMIITRPSSSAAVCSVWRPRAACRVTGSRLTSSTRAAG